MFIFPVDKKILFQAKAKLTIPAQKKIYLINLQPNFLIMDKNRLKQILFPIVLIALMFIVYKIRQNNDGNSTSPNTVKISGITMGVVAYNVIYLHSDGLDLSEEIDSLLKVWNQSMSTYIPDSEISLFNRDSCFHFVSEYFYPVLEKSKEVYENTSGAFDPTVGPLVNAWGFGPEDSMNPDSAVVDSLLQFVGFDKVNFSSKEVCKTVSGVKLDFSAIAKGYAVDVVADFVKSFGIENLMVEIGGEAVCYGHNADGKDWRLGIENPNPEERGIFAVANMKDMAIATSGNYRNYYVKEGVTYSHTIDPSTGFPLQRNVLSASVFAKDCMTADAYATAFMVLGVEGSKKVLEKVKDVEAFLIYTKENGELSYYVTGGISEKIEVLDGE